MRQRCRGEGVFLASTGKKGREPKTPAVGLRNRCCVVKPDPITTQGQSPWGASEGEERLSTATAAAYYMLLQFTSHPAGGGGKGKRSLPSKKGEGVFWEKKIVACY